MEKPFITGRPPALLLESGFQREEKKLFEAEVTGVEVVKFNRLIHDDELAREEGFQDAAELESEFRKMYPDHSSEDSLFQVIKFRKLPMDEWEGARINEKAMITKRADILFDVGKFDKSVMCYNAALKIDPQDVYLLNRKGDNLSRLGKFPQALECYDQALELEPDNEYVWNNKAIALLNSNRPEEALKANDHAWKSTGRICWCCTGEVSSWRCWDVLTRL